MRAIHNVVIRIKHVFEKYEKEISVTVIVPLLEFFLVQVSLIVAHSGEVKIFVVSFFQSSNIWQTENFLTTSSTNICRRK